MKDKVTSTDIAKRIIHIAASEKINLSITAVQKLLYIVYGTYLVVHEECIFDESPVVLPYGPVFVESYNSLKHKSELKSEGLADDKWLPAKISEEEKSTRKQIDELIKTVLNHFGSWTARELVNWTHREGSAWYLAEREDNRWGNKIGDALIKQEFKSIIVSD